jgi:hypothetical protein
MTDDLTPSGWVVGLDRVFGVRVLKMIELHLQPALIASVAAYLVMKLQQGPYELHGQSPTVRSSGGQTRYRQV